MQHKNLFAVVQNQYAYPDFINRQYKHSTHSVRHRNIINRNLDYRYRKPI